MTATAEPAPNAAAHPTPATEAARTELRAPVAAILTLGFGTAVLQWAIGYVCRLPGIEAAPWILGVLFLAVLVASGAVSARLAPGGARTAAFAGVVAAGLNLLILGSLKEFRTAAGLALPGSLLASGGLAALGASVAALLGVRPRAEDVAATGDAWVSQFARVVCVATLLLLAAGGLVTSHDAGLAVPDWPNTYGSNMFLFPLEHMTGGIYYEHAHRLFGALVGLTTITLAGLVLTHDPRRLVRGVAAGAVVLVIVQGVMGGLRVTGKPTLSAEAADLAPNLGLAVVHGVTGQLFFALLVGLAAVTSVTWRGSTAAAPSVHTETERLLGSWLLGVLVLQLVLGALVRHFHIEATIHIVGACAVVGLAGFAGARAWGLHSALPVLPRVGGALAALVCVQLLLGIAALVVTNLDPIDGARPPIEIPIATAHQTIGALLLGLSVLLRLWIGRLLAEPPPAA